MGTYQLNLSFNFFNTGADSKQVPDTPDSTMLPTAALETSPQVRSSTVLSKNKIGSGQGLAEGGGKQNIREVDTFAG